MEEKSHPFNHRLPPKNRIIEVVHTDSYISFEYIFLKSVGSAQINSVDIDLQNWNESIASRVDKIESNSLYL